VINLPHIEIPPRFRKPLIWAGWPLFFLAVMMITLFASLPRDRVKDRIEATLAQDPMSGQPGALGADVTIGDLGLTLFTGAGIKAKDVVIRTRPPNPNDKPARYIVDDVTVRAGLLGLLFNLVGLVGGSITALVGVLLSFLILYYLFQPQVKAFFA
jgi:hypothetical protein